MYDNNKSFLINKGHRMILNVSFSLLLNVSFSHMLFYGTFVSITSILFLSSFKNVSYNFKEQDKHQMSSNSQPQPPKIKYDTASNEGREGYKSTGT